MWQRFPQTHLWLAVWFAACSLPPAAAQQVVPYGAPSMTAESEQVGCPIRYTLRHFAGQAPGYDTGVTRFELFVPLAEYDGSNLLFCDLQPMLYNDGNWGSNLGLGYRWYSPAFDRVFGLYGYFDYRQTTYHRFQQGTLGFDSLGNWIDARGNLYLPDGEQKPLPAEAVAPPHFQGHRLLYGGYERALLGGDVEVGVRVPLIGGTQSRVLGGLYWFDGDDEQDVQGWKARLETHWTANVSTDVAVYDDDVFGTSLMVGIGFNMQTESFSPFHPQIHSFRRGSQRHITNVAADRVAEPVCRLPNIAVRQGEYRAALEGEPWQILHVVEGATGGDGSFERPFGTLDQAMDIAQDGYLVYTPYGGTYQPTPMFVVPEGVSLLSNAQVHYLPTDAGWLPLPLSGASPDLSAAPQILGSVTLSDRATLDGFWVVGYGDALGEAGLVRVAGVSDATVANSRITAKDADAGDAELTGNVTVDAQNRALIDATVLNAVTSGDTAAGVTLAFNTVGWQAQNILFQAVDALISTDIGTEEKAGARATVTDTLLVSDGDVTVNAAMDARIDADVGNEATSAASALYGATGLAISALLASNMVSSEAVAGSSTSSGTSADSMAPVTT